MPLNEARSFKRSNLTREQRQEAEAAIYGVRESISMPVNNFGQLSQQEIETMRKLVSEHDNQGKIAEFDLNNPPKLAYRHQDFPRMVYNHAASEPSRIEFVKNKEGDVQERHIEPKLVTKLVKNEDELEAALKAGWSKEVPQMHSDAIGDEQSGDGEESELKPPAAPVKAPRKPRAKKAIE